MRLRNDNKERETFKMIKLIIGLKGSGKTKFLIDSIKEAVDGSKGCVIAIERGQTLRFDVDHSVRLIDIDEYDISDFNSFYGFLSGLLAGNYDISDIFVDATFKIGGRDYDAFAKMIDKLKRLCDDFNCDIVFTASCDTEDLPERVRKYIVER